MRLADQKRPSSYVMHASGRRCAGERAGDGDDQPVADGEGTTLTYSADAVVGGPVAGVGQRMITGVAKRMAGQFFSAIDAELTGASPSGAAPPPSRRAPRGPRRLAAPQVFAGRAAACAGRGPGDVQTFLLGVGTGGLLTALSASRSATSSAAVR